MRAWWNLIRNGRKTFIHTLSIITFSKFTNFSWQELGAWCYVYVRGKASSSLSLLNITISTFAKLYATLAVNRYLITSLWWVASQHRWHVRCWWEIGPLGADTGPGPARYRSPLLRVSVATLRGSGYSITPPLATHLQFICFSVFRLAFFCPCEDCLLKSYVKHILYSVRAGQSSQNFWFILRNYVWTHN